MSTGARGRWALRVAGSLAFLVVALWGIGLEAVARTLAGVEVGWFAAALAVLGLSYGIAAVRWWLLLRRVGVDIGLPAAVRFSFVGLLFNNVLPTGFGGDAVRTWMVGRRAGRMSAVAASVLIDRLAAVWSLVALGLVALAVEADELPAEVVASMLAAAGVVAAGTVVLLAPAPVRWLTRAAARWRAVAQAIDAVGAGLRAYRHSGRLLAGAFALSVAGQVAVATAAWLLARGLGLDLSPLLLAVTIPVALLASALPVSINGLGVREAAFRALLVPAGVAPADAVAFSLATVAAGALVSLPGAVWWWLARGAQPRL